MTSTTKVCTVIALAGAVFAGAVTDASAATARQYRMAGHGYGNHRAAVAGAALGIVGLAAGAAAADRYDDGYGYGYGPGYYGQGYYAPGPYYPY